MLKSQSLNFEIHQEKKKKERKEVPLEVKTKALKTYNAAEKKN